VKTKKKKNMPHRHEGLGILPLLMLISMLTFGSTLGGAADEEDEEPMFIALFIVEAIVVRVNEALFALFLGLASSILLAPEDFLGPAEALSPPVEESKGCIMLDLLRVFSILNGPMFDLRRLSLAPAARLLPNTEDER
jgi:hypothetical protein